MGSGASAGHFDTPPSRLTWADASMLAGLLQAPTACEPLTDHMLAKQRQQHVLAQLVANGKLTQRQAAAAYCSRLPLG